LILNNHLIYYYITSKKNPVHMKTAIKEKVNRLEQKRLELMAELEILNEDKLNYKPAPGKWSIIQIVHHLIKSEQLSVIYIKRNITNKSGISKSSFRAKFNAFVLKWGLILPLKLKAPNNVSDVPDFDTFENAKSKWDKVRNSFVSVIESMADDLLSKDIFKHPIAGKMNLEGTIDFFDAHFKHHLKQIKSLLTNLNPEKK